MNDNCVFSSSHQKPSLAVPTPVFPVGDKMGGLLQQIRLWLPALEPKHRCALQRGNTSQPLQQPQVSAAECLPKVSCKHLHCAVILPTFSQVNDELQNGLGYGVAH